MSEEVFDSESGVISTPPEQKGEDQKVSEANPILPKSTTPIPPISITPPISIPLPNKSTLAIDPNSGSGVLTDKQGKKTNLTPEQVRKYTKEA